MNQDRTPERTPRDTRLRLNRMERWFRKHTDRFTPEDQVFMRLAFEYAEKPHDADVVAQALRDGYPKRSVTSDEAGVSGHCSTKASATNTETHD